MNIKIREISNLYETLQSLTGMKLEFDLAYKVACISRAVREQYNKANLIRKDVLEKFAKRDENGNVIFNQENGTIEVDDKQVKELDAALNELYDKEIQIETEKLKLEDLKDIDLTVGQIEILIPFIEK